MTLLDWARDTGPYTPEPTLDSGWWVVVRKDRFKHLHYSDCGFLNRKGPIRPANNVELLMSKLCQYCARRATGLPRNPGAYTPEWTVADLLERRIWAH